ncbi:MAG: hypothetical protein Q4E12_00420 [Coriobacteriia bacterium]|nr:hypothetical protein [Coriobacteriia bacterium]
MITTTHITVDRQRISFVVKVPAAQQRTSPQLMQRVLQDFPRLPQHSCVNAEGPLFGAVMDHTSTPHLLEHLTIDAQVRAHAQGRFRETLFVGNTQWVDQSQGLARIQVNYADDLVALRCFNESVTYLNAIMLG